MGEIQLHLVLTSNIEEDDEEPILKSVGPLLLRQELLPQLEALEQYACHSFVDGLLKHVRRARYAFLTSLQSKKVKANCEFC